MKISSAVCVVVSCLGAMTGFVVLSIKGQDPTAFAMFSGSVILPQAVALFRQDKTQQIQQDATADIAVIKERTNGPLDRQADTLDRILNKLDVVDDRLVDLERRKDAGSS